MQLYKNYLHITKEEERNVFIDFVKNNSNDEIRKRIGAVFREAITKYMNEINRIIKEEFKEMKVDNTNAELLFPPIPYKHEEGFTEEEKRDFIGHFLNFTMAGVIIMFKFVKECRNYDSLKKPLKAHLKAINYYYKRCLDIYEKQEKKETVEYIDKIVSYNLTGGYADTIEMVNKVCDQLYTDFYKDYKDYIASDKMITLLSTKDKKEIEDEPHKLINPYLAKLNEYMKQNI